VGGSRIDEVGMPELPDVSQTLEGGCVDHPHGRRVEPNRVPEGIADDEGAVSHGGWYPQGGEGGNGEMGHR
jgi:hypothetical protein